jgi:Domain of unknown function (DUF4157)
MPEAGSRGPTKAESDSAAQPEPVAAEVESDPGAALGNRAVADWVRNPGSGRPLDLALRAELEPAFGEELGSVRVHDDASAQRAAHEANAQAFTHGEHVVLDASLREVLQRAGGRELLAHELAHVIQQRGGGRGAPGPAPDGAPEAEADAAATAVAGGGAAPALGGTAVGLARVPRDVAGLSEQELAAEHDATQRWLLARQPGDPDYQETLEYFQRLEQEVAARPSATAGGTTPSPTGVVSSSSSTTDVAASSSRTADVTTSSATSEPLASFDPNAPLAPEEMVSHVLNQRGFTANPPGTLNVQGQPLGSGYSTNSMVQVVDANGTQVATEWSQYGGSRDAHAEIQALDALRARLAGRQIPGGKLVVAVDQNTCGNCTEAIRRFAREHGLETIEVYGPGRGRVNNPALPVTPKTAARTAYSGIENAPPTETELLWGETVNPAGPTGSASGGAPLVTEPISSTAAEGLETPVTGENAGPVVEPTAPPPEGVPVTPETGVPPPEGSGGLEMVPGSGGAALQVGLGVAYMFAHRAAIEHRRDTEGFAPTGPNPDESIITQLGRFLMDPTFDDAVPAASRFNLPVWRNRMRSIAGAKATGETFRMSWERERPGILPGMVTHDSVDVEYTRQPDGTFGPGRVVDGDAEGFTPPDVNRILDPNVSNDSIMYMLSDHSNEA